VIKKLNSWKKFRGVHYNENELQIKIKELNDDLKEWDNMEIPDKKMDLLLINEIMKKC
jgi:hypothetical protein